MKIQVRRISMRTGMIGAVLLATLLLGACGGNDEDDEAALASATATSGPRMTSIAKSRFESPMKVALGSTVTWVNEDAISHNVVGDNGAFRSDKMDKGDTFTHEFKSAGLFEYTCTFHPGMDGLIQVE